MKTIPYRRKINYYETDRMNIVHHSNYARYLEESRMDFMRQVGISYDDLEEKGIVIPVLELHDQYIKSLTFGDEIEIRISLIKLTAVRFKMKYEIINIATGEVPGLVPLNLKKHFPEVYEVFEKYLEPEEN